MKVFLDTWNPVELREMAELGLIAGATCNPAILSRQTKGYEPAVKAMIEAVNGGIVFAQVLADKAQEMVEQAKRIDSWGPQMIIKLPANREGMRACAALSSQDIRTAITLIYSPAQAVMAAHAGACYVAPFVARACDIGQDGVKTVEEIARIYEKQGLATRILAASLRTPSDVVKVLALGEMDLTLPYGALMSLIDHPASDATLASFQAGWQETGLEGIL